MAGGAADLRTAEPSAMTIRKSIVVECTPERSFRAFCDEMNLWWPGGFGGKDARPSLEPRVGGRFYERRPDGSEYVIGTVTAYQPPTIVAFTWRAPSWDVETEVAIRFSGEGARTRIELVHTGWERDAKTRDGRKSYDSGWDGVLGYYVKYANAAP